MIWKREDVRMRRTCERKQRAKRLFLVAIGAALVALVFYCVPWWVFLIIGIVSLLAAGCMLLRD